ncbi:MAG: DUF1501 domain-containing protein [Acidimicrobiales bacterium]
MTITRRDFVKTTLAAAAAGVVVPEVWARAARAAVSGGTHQDRVLVVAQLAGGNDGLNTIVPYADPAYYRLRPSIAVPANKVLRADNEVGFHPALSGVKSMYDAGNVAVVRGVGYPKFTLSHFDAMHVYQQADPTGGAAREGWVGSFLDDTAANAPLAAWALGEVRLPAELRSSRADVSVVSSASDYHFTSIRQHDVAPEALYKTPVGRYGGPLNAAVATADEGIAAVRDATTRFQSTALYWSDPKQPKDFGNALRLAAALIVTRPGVKVIHVTLGGFDSHAAERGMHDSLLAIFDAAVSGFFADLRTHGAASRVAMLTWSEFGRRANENNSAGTDHGTAQPMLLIGDPVLGKRMVGAEPSLTDLDQGNLRMTTDFRSVYQSVIGQHLGADPAQVLGGTFPELSLFR